MDWSKHQIICNKHPNEIPQPGVCPSCLRERLSRLITTGQHATRASFVNSTPSSSSPVNEYHYNDYSSASSASDISPRMNRGGRGHQRVASDVLDSIYLSVKGNISNLGLNKSRSVAFAASNVVRDHCHDVVNTKKTKKKKKKAGFWNRLRFGVGSKTKI